MKLIVPVLIGAAAVAAYAFGSGTSFASGWKRLGSGTLEKGKRYRISHGVDVTVPPTTTKAQVQQLWQTFGGNPNDIGAFWGSGDARPGDWASEDPQRLGRVAFEVVPSTGGQLEPIAGLMAWVQG